MAGNLSENRIDAPLGIMRWRRVSFLHWTYAPDLVGALLPRGLEVDAHDGRAWVGLVAFEMADVRLPGTPAVPRFSTFPEVNVRTYVRRPGGRDGLFFFTLEASRLITVVARPMIGIAYSWAQMAVSQRGEEVRYRTARRWPSDSRGVSRLGVRYGAAIPPEEQTDFDHYLTGRWQAYSHRRGRLYCTPVEHEPWPLHRAETTMLEDRLIASCGLPPPQDPPVAHYAPAVNVRLGFPRPVT